MDDMDMLMATSTFLPSMKQTVSPTISAIETNGNGIDSADYFETNCVNFLTNGTKAAICFILMKKSDEMQSTGMSSKDS